MDFKLAKNEDCTKRRNLVGNTEQQLKKVRFNSLLIIIVTLSTKIITSNKMTEGCIVVITY